MPENAMASGGRLEEIGFSFSNFAAAYGVQKFAGLLSLANCVDTYGAALTIFAPTDEAIDRLGSQLPTETNALRDLIYAHISIGSSRYVIMLRTPYQTRKTPACCATLH